MLTLSAVALTSLLVLTANEAPTRPVLTNCWLLGGAPASGPCRVMTAEDEEEIRHQIELELHCHHLLELQIYSTPRVREFAPECIEILDLR
jgi:hypothetical protein